MRLLVSDIVEYQLRNSEYGDCYETFSQQKFPLDDYDVVSRVQETGQIKTAATELSPSIRGGEAFEDICHYFTAAEGGADYFFHADKDYDAIKSTNKEKLEVAFKDVSWPEILMPAHAPMLVDMDEVF